MIQRRRISPVLLRRGLVLLESSIVDLTGRGAEAAFAPGTAPKGQGIQAHYDLRPPPIWGCGRELLGLAAMPGSLARSLFGQLWGHNIHVDLSTKRPHELHKFRFLLVIQPQSFDQRRKIGVLNSSSVVVLHHLFQRPGASIMKVGAVWAVSRRVGVLNAP